MTKLKSLLHTNIFSYLPSLSISFWIALVLSIAIISATLFYNFILNNHELIRNLGLVCVAVIGFPMLIWRTRIADKQTVIAGVQASTAKASQTADAYTKAIEQIGASGVDGTPCIELRLGGLYALEKIAKSNPDYHHQIIEVLCAYVRLHAVKPQTITNNEVFEKMVEKGGFISNENPSLRVDIQTAVTIIGRRKVEFDTENSRLNLSHVYLPGLVLKDVNLEGANLSNSILINADFENVILDRASFYKSDLSYVTMGNTSCQSVNLSFTNLKQSSLILCNFIRASLSNANLESSCLEDSDFSETRLSGSNLEGGHIVKVDFTNANLAKAKLESVEVDDSSFDHANFNRAVLRYVVILDSSFKHASLRKADFSEACLNQIDFSCADLSETTFVNADVTAPISFIRTNLIGANFTGVQIDPGLLKRANLEGITPQSLCSEK